MPPPGPKRRSRQSTAAPTPSPQQRRPPAAKCPAAWPSARPAPRQAAWPPCPSQSPCPPGLPRSPLRSVHRPTKRCCRSTRPWQWMPTGTAARGPAASAPPDACVRLRVPVQALAQSLRQVRGWRLGRDWTCDFDSGTAHCHAAARGLHRVPFHRLHGPSMPFAPAMSVKYTAWRFTLHQGFNSGQYGRITAKFLAQTAAYHLIFARPSQNRPSVRSLGLLSIRR